MGSEASDDAGDVDWYPPDSDPEQRPFNAFVRGNDLATRAERPFSSLSFHQFCALSPREAFYAQERADSSVRIMPDIVRPVLRHWPLTMFGMTLLYLLAPLVEPGLEPVWAFFPPMTADNLVWVAGAVVVWATLFVTIGRVGIVTRYTQLAKPAFVYGLFGVLLAGTLFSVFLVWHSDSPATLPRNVVFGSGFLFAAYVSGMIAYDLLIRTENLLENLGEKNVVPDGTRYETAFLDEIREKFSASAFGVPLALVFGITFTSQLVTFWLLQNGPHQLNSMVALACNAFFDAILMTAIFQFLIFIRQLNLLLDDKYERDGEAVRLRFQPFHPDGRGGFRDIGRAAMQVNALVIIAGLYYVYRLYVQGLRALPVGGFDALQDAQAILWLVDFGGPIVIYAAVSAVWLYYTFWTTHLKMARDKERMILTRQASNRSDDASEPIGGVNDRAGYEELLSSPVWPLDSRQLQTVVISNIIPLFLTLSSLPI
ncbi:hypothetical protein [Haloplanus sp. C73]|uniref:hypothetical protein n=1 Tax=Haloplanus sp. C73 TaxID=3421641 RepID=UPI003EBE74C7